MTSPPSIRAQAIFALPSGPAAALALALALPAGCAAPSGGPTSADPWIVHAGGAGPGRGRRIVLVAGDEEYRSEEALPQLAAILAARHGFHCTVLFSVDPLSGAIEPGNRQHIPGLAALDAADMLVLFTRFRRLSDEDMAHIVRFVESGRPLLGIRTATHAFAYEPGDASPYAQWSWDSAAWPGGFGRQVLGETWVAHHGAHGSESTRGVIAAGADGHPMLRGVTDVWGPTDVYAVGALPPDASVLLEGAVLAGMQPDALPVADGRNSPRMPIVWTRERELSSGRRQRIIASTIGAATDLECEDLRRLLVNACYWGLGLEERIPARSAADLVGAYAPSPFGFDGHRRGRRPSDVTLRGLRL